MQKVLTDSFYWIEFSDRGRLTAWNGELFTFYGNLSENLLEYETRSEKENRRYRENESVSYDEDEV